MSDSSTPNPNYREVRVAQYEEKQFNIIKEQYERDGWRLETTFQSPDYRLGNEIIVLAFRRITPRGTITLADGVVTAVRAHVEDFEPTLVPGGQALYETLKSLEKQGWRVHGKLPEYTTIAQYVINIIKDESLPRVTG